MEAGLVHATWHLAIATWVLVAANLILALGTLWYFRRQVQDAKSTTELNLHLQLMAAWESEQISAARSRAAAARLHHQIPAPNDTETILDSLEGMAYHANRKNIELDLVWNDFGYAVRCYWHELSNYVLTQRGIRSDRTLFAEVELLENTLKVEEARRRGILGVFPTEDELKAFLTSEATTEDQIRRAQGN
jgi:hypothetical protein